MPLATGSSGDGYFYPVAQKPNSSFPSLDLRSLGSAPATTGLGRLYVLEGTDDLYYKDPSGNVIPVAAATGSATFDTIDALKFINGRSHLVLSSSVGSRMVVSGGLYIVDGQNANDVSITQATNGTMNLGASAGININNGAAFASSVSFANLVTFSAVNTAFHIRATAGHLILSSTIGSVIKMSGAIGAHKATTATLPAGSDVMTGTILWDDTRKTMKIYGPLGWTPILTGAAG